MSLRHGIRSTAHGRIRLYACGAHANGDSLDAGVGTCPVQPIASRQTKCSHPSIPAAAGPLYQFPWLFLPPSNCARRGQSMA
jgi:hypothetical protein